MFGWPKRERWIVDWPTWPSQQVVATYSPPSIFERPIRSLADPKFGLSAEEVVKAVNDGKYLEQQPIRSWWPFRRFATHQVLYKGHVLFVIWGYPSQVERYLGVQMKISKKYQKLFQAFVLGWDFPVPQVGPMARTAPVVAVLSQI